MNELQIFENPEFGKVRTIEIDGKPYFYGVDVATALDYIRPSKAVSDHCKGVLTQDTIRNSGGYPEKLIPEGDVYRLIVKASEQSTNPYIKEKAERFASWVFDEVLPSIRQTGHYITQQAQSLELLQGMLDQLKLQNAEIQKATLQSKQAIETTNAIKEAIVEEYDNWRDDIKHKVSAIQKKTGETYADTWNKLYSELEKRGRCDLSIRVNNGRFRLHETGATKKAIDAFGRLDVIEAEPRLKEIFTAIVKEYAVKYAV